MSVKIRLTRHGKKRVPFYHVVIADSRAPRDGRFIERIGSYNPVTDPATIDLDFDKALAWLQKGAQPTDTCRAILSYKGVLLKDHLLRGVAKNALTLEQAEAKFQKWVDERQASIQSKKDNLAKATDAEIKERLKQEVKINQERKDAIAKKHSDAVAAAKAKETASTEAAPEAEA